MGDVHVFGFLDIIEQEPDQFTIQYAKSKIDCPRCKKNIEKAEKLLANRSLLKKQDIAGICDHCWKQLLKIQKLVRLTQGTEHIAAGTEADALKTQIEQERRLYEREVKAPQELKERATTLGTLAPPTHVLEGKKKDEKPLVREKSPGAEERISMTRFEKPSSQEESQRAADKKSKARDEKLIARGESQREKDTKIIAGQESLSGKGETTSKQARGKQPTARDESLSAKDKKSKAKDEQMTTQGESLRAKDNKSMPREELPSAKDQKSKTRGEKPHNQAQIEPQSTKDQKSKAIGEKPIAQEGQQSTRDQKSKARGEKPVGQEEPQSTRDQQSKARGEKPVPQEDPQSTRDQKSKARGEKPVAQEEPQNTRGRKSKAKDEQPIAKDESLIAKDKKVTPKNEKSIPQEKELKAKDNKTKPSVEAKEKTLKAKEEKLDGKENTLKPKPEKLRQEPTSAEQLKVLLADEKIRKEIEKLAEDKRKKQQQEEKQLMELAEKKAKETALQSAKEVEKFRPPKVALPVSEPDDDDDDREFGHDVYKAPVRSDIIIGETICKHKIRQNTDEDLDTIDKESTQKLGKHRAPHVTSERHGQPFERLESSKKGKITESESHAKVSALGSEKSKNGVVETEKTEKGVKVKEKFETATKKPLQDSEATINKDGKIRYALSDPTFIEKGWTKLPLEKVVRKMNVYRMRPSKPEFDWFEHHKNRVLEYDTGERLAEVEDSGRGRWYYRSGALAMDYYDAEESNAGQRFVVYSSDAPDARGRPRPRAVLATFDHAGNGIVYDHAGKTRLKYNQTEGIVLDREIGPVSHWKWHTLNEPPVLQQVMVDTAPGRADPAVARLAPGDRDTPRRQDDAMLSIERDNFVKEKTRKSTKTFKPFQIKMKALKINENFSLRVLDQASVYLMYRDGSTNLKINIGMLLDHQEIVDTDAAEVGEVATAMEALPARARSLARLQRAVARARARDTAQRARRERLQGGPQGKLSASASVDALHAAASRPRPLYTPVSCPRPTHTLHALHAPFATCDTTPSELLNTCSCDLYCKPLF